MLATDELKPVRLNELIQKGGIDPNAFEDDDKVFSLFGLVVMKGDAEMAEMLIKAGAGVNLTFGNGETSLFSADVNVARILLKYGANVRHKNDFGESVLERHLTNIEILKVLLDNEGKITRNSILAKLLLDEDLREKVKSNLLE